MSYGCLRSPSSRLCKLQSSTTTHDMSEVKSHTDSYSRPACLGCLANTQTIHHRWDSVVCSRSAQQSKGLVLSRGPYRCLRSCITTPPAAVT